jgi:anthranilate phosphoribosyltransferase
MLYIFYDITIDCIGETPKELCGMVRSMKKNSKPVEIPGFKCLDIVGMRYR